MATSIQIEQIGSNRYAPEGADAVNLYSFGGCSGLTVAQLMMAVCIRQASVVEEQSVLKMNEINASAGYLQALAACGEHIMEKSSLDATFDLTKVGYSPRVVDNKTTYWEFMVEECGIPETSVPHTVSKMNDKTKTFDLLKNEMEAASSDNEDQTIDLQSYLSRRDSTYNASASTVKRLGDTMNSVAQNF